VLDRVGEDVSFFQRIFRRGVGAPYREGMEAYNAGHWEEALSAFRRVLHAGGSSRDPLVGLARFYAAEASCHLARAALEGGDPKRALRWLEPALQWNPRHPAMLFFVALANAEVADLKSSASCLRALLVQNPADAQAHLLAAAVHFARGEHDHAVQHVACARELEHSVTLSTLVARVVDSLAHGFGALEALRREPGDATTRRA
jgi:tetratricopeptide (TPR) repeat protein